MSRPFAAPPLILSLRMEPPRKAPPLHLTLCLAAAAAVSGGAPSSDHSAAAAALNFVVENSSSASSADLVLVASAELASESRFVCFEKTIFLGLGHLLLFKVFAGGDSSESRLDQLHSGGGGCQLPQGHVWLPVPKQEWRRREGEQEAKTVLLLAPG